jgi:hypothetical protein
MLHRIIASASSLANSQLRTYRKNSLQGRSLFKREAYWLDALPGFDDPGRIPRIIHQVYPTLPLPEPLQRNVEALKAANPGWEHRLYDEAACQAFIGERYGERVLDLYRRINPQYGAARGDLARYLIVYAVGGVYLDIKSYFDRPIGSVISQDDGYILAQWDNGADGDNPGFGRHPDVDDVPGGEFQQWHVIAAPMHPFLRAVIARVLANIETYRPWRHGVGRNGVFRVTGPIAYTRAILPVLDRHPHRAYADSGEIGLRYSIGEGYQHMAAFPKHYSLHTAPVVEVPLWLKPLAALYGFVSSKVQESGAET